MDNSTRHSTCAEIADLVDRIRRRVDDDPDGIAIVDPVRGVEISYGRMWGRSGAIAARLIADGVRPGDLVAIDGARGAGLVLAVLGVVRAGAAYLPVDRHWPTARVHAVLADASPSAGIVVDDGDPARLTTPSVLRVPFDFADESTPETPSHSPDDPLYVAYTSGSTGGPKGVVVPRRAAARLVDDPVFCDLSSTDRVAFCANPAFDATTFELWGPLVVGGAVVVMPGVTELPLDEWTGLLRDEGVTAMFLTTSLFHMIADGAPDSLSSLDTVVVGGEQLDLAAVAKVLAADPPGRLVNGYGPTETTTFAMYHDCTAADVDAGVRIPLGRPIQRTTAAILDDRGLPVPDGEQGELWIGGPGVALGYLGRPDLTRDRFVPDPATGRPRYRTGDVVRRRPDGLVEMLGRRDRQVKLRGFRIELDEIERAVLDSGEALAAVVDRRGVGTGALLAAIVVPSAAADPDDDVLRARLRSALATVLPEYMVPTAWSFHRGPVPYGSTGKLDRDALVASASPTGAEPIAPVVETDRVTAIVAELLPGATVTPDSNFIEVGGNSIMAVQAAFLMSERFGVTIDPVDVLTADRIGDLTP